MRKNKSGMTLIEIVVTVAIMGTLLSLVGVFFATGLNSYKTNSEMLASQSNIRGVMFELSSKLREARLDEITINEQHSEITIGDIIYSFSTTDSSISRTKNGETVVIGKNILNFRVELVNEITVVYTIQSINDNINLKSSVTLREFDRPSPDS